jgi:hypothetical protein
MSVMTWIRKAKCQDCKFLQDHPTIKRRYKCGNIKSPEFETQRAKRQLVCNEWELLYS